MTNVINPASMSAHEAVAQAAHAMQRGDRLAARRYAAYAAHLEPTLEQPWLILGAISEPQASIEYLKRALAINPGSKAARDGMRWAADRLRSSSPEATQPVRVAQPTQPVRVANVKTGRSSTLPQGALLVLAGLVVLMLLGASGVWMVMASGAAGQIAQAAAIRLGAIDNAEPTATRISEVVQAAAATASAFPTHTATAIPSPTFTPLMPSTATATQSFAATLPMIEPTDPTITPEIYLSPTPTPVPPTEAPPPPPEVSIPPEVGEGERWIDVDLSDQMVYAYEGDTLVNSFLVSTGTWMTPTVIGSFHIYVKYPYATMSGPGYYLPDVPYVMYFYEGYGLHGTYWHNNFGMPMSHGCVNLRTRNSGWVYNWSSVGTLVNVHD